MKSYSLIFFTLSAQAAAGAYFVTYLLGPPRLFSLPTLAAIFILFSAGLVISLLHLGSPQRACRALLNLRTSWLSREIFMALLFAGLLLANLIFAWAGSAPPLWLVQLTSMAGLLLIFSMSSAYALPALPARKPAIILTSFTCAALLLGGLLALFLLSVQHNLTQALTAGSLFLLSFWLLIDLVLQSSASPPPAASLIGAIHQPGRASPQLRRLHLILIPLGFTAAALTLLPAAAPIQTALLGLALALVSAGQFANRLRFYQEGLGRRV
jgi:anaerobic dimethyl sulfoxide reductase subunit C